jgi:hypothetical protein
MIDAPPTASRAPSINCGSQCVMFGPRELWLSVWLAERDGETEEAMLDGHRSDWVR